MPRLLLLLVPVLAVAGAGIGVVTRHSDPPPVVETPEASPSPTAPAFVVVDVVGAVARPGVVRLPTGSRVLDALLAAGGMTGDADLFAVNKAALLRDGMRIYVPKPGEAPPAGSAGTPAETKVDVNRASEAELVALPGVGPSTASRILRSRQQRPFARVEELQTRGLVTARVYADIKDLVTTR
ncbi:MAG: SLBB domain-containing protein [Chloroflexota bacterium]|nr:SLBB domain-containing protein [Chloroflexota bacterium]MDE3193571.1 SLBB domain-containing protein [Chloroflexota bacterium]